MFDGFVQEFIAQYGTQIIYTALTVIFGALAMAAKRLAKKVLDSKEKKQVAREVVMFVEQVYKNSHGEEKLNAALETAKEMLAERGIVFYELEMRVMIESVLGEMNKVFDEDEEKDGQESQCDEVPPTVETTAQITYTNGREEPDEDEYSVGMTE